MYMYITVLMFSIIYFLEMVSNDIELWISLVKFDFFFVPLVCLSVQCGQLWNINFILPVLVIKLRGDIAIAINI